MNVQFWGTRGSLPTPGPSTQRYGGNTSCVEVRGDDPARLVVLDAGTGICRARRTLSPRRAACRHPALAPAHGPHPRPRVLRRAVPSRSRGAHLGAELDDAAAAGPAEPLPVAAAVPRPVARPALPAHRARRPARHFELAGAGHDGTCLPSGTDGRLPARRRPPRARVPQRPRACARRARVPRSPPWTSGLGLAEGADMLIHDAQYADDEYAEHVGWGHSSVGQTVTSRAPA